jgi:hypothetical protein
VETQILSNKAIEDLRVALQESYGQNFDTDLSDEDIHQIGELFLAGIASYLKMRVSSPDIAATSL